MNKLILFLLLCSTIIKTDAGVSINYEEGGGIYYPIDSNGQTCDVKIAVQYTTDQPEPVTTPVSLFLSVVFTIKTIASNLVSSSLFELTKSVPVNSGKETVSLSTSDYSGSGYVTYNSYNCKEAALLSATFQQIKDGIFAGQHYLIVRFQNIDVWDYNLVNSGSIPSFKKSKSLGNNFFLFPLSQPLYRTNYHVQFAVGYNSVNLGFTVDYPYSLDVITNTKIESLYPSNENLLFTGMGVGIITIESSQQTLYIQIENSSVSAIKIGGSSSKGIYILHFSSQPLPSTYTVRIQNGDTLYNITKSFNQSKILNPFTLDNATPTTTQDNQMITSVVVIKNINVGHSMESYGRNGEVKLFDLGFPFGYNGGTSSLTSFSISTFEINKSIKYTFGNVDLIYTAPAVTPVDTEQPVLLNYELVSIDGGTRLLFKISFADDLGSGVKSFQTKSSIYSIGPYITSGNQVRGEAEIDMEYQDTSFIILCDNGEMCTTYQLDSFIFNEEILPLVPPAKLVHLTSPKKLLSVSNNFKYLDDIIDISIKYNDLNVTGKSTYNVMTIKLANFPNAPIERTLLVRFYPAKDNPYAADNTPVYYARYNSDATVVAWQCEFIVPANIGIGELQYSITLDIIGPKIIYSDSLGSAFKLIISDSQQYDFIGPIVTASTLVKEFNTLDVTIGWLLTIEDSVNGYIGNGYLLIRGSIDMTVRNITTGSRLNGNIFKGDFIFSLTIPYTCISQTYSIVYAKFIDSQGWVTEFDESIEKGTLMNPFYPLLDKINFRHYYHECDSSKLSLPPRLPPVLESFTIQTYNSDTINVFGAGNERTITFTFKVFHIDSIITNPVPTIYLTSTNQEIVYSKQSEVTFTPIDASSVQFIITMEVPYGFGYAKGILVSLYGIVSNSGVHAGFSSLDLKSSSPTPFPFKIDTKASIITSLTLQGSSQLSSNGGLLWLYGKSLNEVTQLEITFSNGTNHILNVISPFHTVFSVIFPPTDDPVRVKAKKSNTIFSNIITIEPFLYKDIILPINPGETPSPTPTVTPTPSNILCKSTCGISNNQGYCSTQGYCICNSPYIGSDCSSTIIIIAPPVINETQPSTEIKIPNEEIKYSSIVSIVSIRELNFQFDQVYSYTFEKWVYTSILDSESKRKYSYFSNITNSNNQVISNITVILEWNSIETTVEFAGQPITLLPSSIKYTIELSEYPFSSDLNSLQLIMSTSIIKSSNNDECLTGKSNSEFGNSSSSTIDNHNNSDSNYIELKVDNYIFYGRFIKRALVDGNILSVSNTKLSDDNVEVKIGSSSSKIGINIPWYRFKAIIDPDFSLLIQSNTNEDDNCSDNGLTSAQLAGIIIGSVALFIILVIITFAIIYKSSRCFAVKIFFYKLFRKSKQ